MATDPDTDTVPKGRMTHLRDARQVDGEGSGNLEARLRVQHGEVEAQQEASEREHVV